MEVESWDFGAAAERRGGIKLICEICEQALATISCKADAALLCSACDLDVHSASPLAFRHERLPISSIFGRTVDLLFDGEEERAEAPWWLLHGLRSKAGESPEIRVAPQPLLEEGFWKIGRVVAPINGVGGIDFGRSKICHASYGVSSSDTSAAPDRSWKPISPDSAATDREARVMRYREKRKNRRFGRTIRYASRKACAEMRPRVKGRFAKRHDRKVDFSQMIFSAGLDEFFGFDNSTGR